MSEQARIITLGVLASGSGTNLQAIIDNIESGSLSARIGVVISNKADAYVLERARKHGIDACFFDPTQYGNRQAFEQTVVEKLIRHEVELVILAGFMRIVTRTLIEPFRERIMNIHPALLPAFPGLHAQRQALDYGVKVAGATVHFVDEGMDTGPIILQAAVPVMDNDAEENLSARILQQEHRIFSLAIQLYAEGRLKIDGRRVIISGHDTWCIAPGN